MDKEVGWIVLSSVLLTWMIVSSDFYPNEEVGWTVLSTVAALWMIISSFSSS